MALTKVHATLKTGSSGNIDYPVILVISDTPYTSPLSLTICGFSSPSTDELLIPVFPTDLLIKHDHLQICKVNYKVGVLLKSSKFVFIKRFSENVKIAVNKGDAYKGGIVQSVQFSPFARRVSAF